LLPLLLGTRVAATAFSYSQAIEREMTGSAWDRQLERIAGWLRIDPKFDNALSEWLSRRPEQWQDLHSAVRPEWSSTKTRNQGTFTARSKAEGSEPQQTRF